MRERSTERESASAGLPRTLASRPARPANERCSMSNDLRAALCEYFGLLNSYIALCAPHEAATDLATCFDEEKRARAEILDVLGRMRAGRQAIRAAGGAVPAEWTPPMGATPIVRTAPNIPADGRGRVVYEGVDATWARDAQRAILAEIERLDAGAPVAAVATAKRSRKRGAPRQYDHADDLRILNDWERSGEKSINDFAVRNRNDGETVEAAERRIELAIGRARKRRGRTE